MRPHFLIFFVVAMVISINGFAETCNSTGEYEYRFGDSENLKDAKQYCESLAIRAAIEECALFVKSVTKIENYKLSEDLVSTIAVAFVKRKKVLECKVNDNVVYTKVSIVLDEEEMKKAIELQRSRSIPQTDARQEHSDGATISGNVIYEEDFSGIEEGLLPENWLGGSTLSVKPSRMRNLSNCLAPFSKGKHEFTIPNIRFPNDWTFEMEMSYDSDPWMTWYKIKLGEIEFKFARNYDIGYNKGGEIFLNGIGTGHSAPEKNKLNLIVIEKRGDVVKLYVNSEKVHTIRVTNSSPPRGIEFSYGNSFAIYKIRVTN